MPRGPALASEARWTTLSLAAVVAADGTFKIPKVPAGSFTLVTWKEFFDPVRTAVEVKAGGTKVDVTLSLAGDVPEGRPLSLSACCDAR